MVRTSIWRIPIISILTGVLIEALAYAAGRFDLASRLSFFTPRQWLVAKTVLLLLLFFACGLLFVRRMTKKRAAQSALATSLYLAVVLAAPVIAGRFVELGEQVSAALTILAVPAALYRFARLLPECFGLVPGPLLLTVATILMPLPLALFAREKELLRVMRSRR